MAQKKKKGYVPLIDLILGIHLVFVLFVTNVVVEF